MTLLLLTLIWWQSLCPLFWPEWEFRRAERRLLLPPSEIVLHLDAPGGRIYREGQSRPILRNDHQFIGVGTDTPLRSPCGIAPLSLPPHTYMSRPGTCPPRRGRSR